MVKGYPVINIVQDGRKRLVYVHALLCRAFYGERPAGMEVRHLDGNRANCTLANLLYGTRAENVADSIAHGTAQFVAGEGHASAKLKESDIRAIRSTNPYRGRIAELARLYGVRQSTITNIIRRRTWKHVLQTTE